LSGGGDGIDGVTATLAVPPVSAGFRGGLARRSAAAPVLTPSFAATGEQREVIRHRRGRLRVLAGPGTGKTATIAAAVAARIADGVDPSSILVLTFARRAAAELASRIAGMVETTTVEPIVRTLHSYCYAVVRSAAEARGEPPPRMLGAGETDLVVRELLAGHLDAGGEGWPGYLRPALSVPGFAADLRRFVLRCAEREITPSELAGLARRHHRPEWRAVAAFIREYRDVIALRQAGGRFGVALDQAELTVAALELLSDPQVREAQRGRIRRIFVDEYQDVDPAQVRLIASLADGAEELVLVGDPDQAIYGFRGAVDGAMTGLDVDATIALTESRRLPEVLLQASRRVASKIPGPGGHRDLRSVVSTPATGTALTASLEVRVLPHPSAEAAFVADQLRRAHLIDGVPWSRMAVLLRSPATSGPGLRRALSTAGVPVAGGHPDLPLSAQPLVEGLLAALRAGMEPESLTGAAAAEFLASPAGGFDVISLRRLRRAIRAACPGEGSAVDVLGAVLRGERAVPEGLPADLLDLLSRPMAVMAAARESAQLPAAEDALWRVWSRTGLSRRLAALSDRGGREGERADGYLDGVVDLFGLAADLAERLPGAGVGGLLELVAAQEVPPGGAGSRGDVRRRTDAVAVLSAHAAKGLEWDTVVVAGAHQETWPDLRRRADLLGLDDVLDVSDGVLVGLGRTARMMAEERRLFYVAVTRARRRLVVTAVEDDEHTPSQFLAELAGDRPVERGWPGDHLGLPRRTLHLAGLVADLRAAVSDLARPADERDTAAAALARLAAAGVRGAHPQEWQGFVGASTSAPIASPSEPVMLSPSQVEAVLSCPLRAVLTRSGGAATPSSAQLLGVLVHAIAQGVTHDLDDTDLEAAVAGMLDGQEHLPPWERARTARLIAAMTEAARTWIAATRASREFVGSEISVDVRLPAVGRGTDHLPDREVRIVGRADWVSRDTAGRLVVTDFKTSASTPSRADLADHPQLAVYQVASALGAFGGGAQAGGGELVMLRSGSPKVLRQEPLDAAGVDAWVASLRSAAAAISGATLVAREGAGCDRCPVRSSCPLRPEGRGVTE
jgi:superfamily I DNA/RNA helicase/RecB family exonuclease